MAYGLPELETSLYLPSTILEDTETSATGIECEKPIEHLNNFLKSRDISPIRYSLKVYLTSKIFFAKINPLIFCGISVEKFFDLVKSSIFWALLKYGKSV